ncbi:MAG: phasin family protein [Noviherbaspirillum sp.]
MVPNIEQYMSSGKAFMESQTTAFNTLATTVLESAEKVATLNLAAFKASAADASNVMSQATNARDSQELFSMITSQVQPNAEKAASYARYLGEIVTEAQSVFSKTFESQIAEVSRAGAAMVDQLSASAPAGTSDAMTLLKSMMGTANAAYEQLNKAAKQTGEAIQAQTAGLSAQYGQPLKAVQTAAAGTEAA